MSSLVFMRVLENTAVRYDTGMAILSLGKLKKIRQDICKSIKPGKNVLDIGCGTGVLTLMLAEKNVNVIGVDASTKMLEVAQAKIQSKRIADQVKLHHMSALELDDAFVDKSFDYIVSTLMFSELSGGEQQFVLKQCRRMLKPSGTLIIGDEVIPEGLINKMISMLIRIPLVIATYIISQSTTRRIKALPSLIMMQQFKIIESRQYLLGGFNVVFAQISETL